MPAAAAKAKQREIRHQDPARRLTWLEAHRRWRKNQAADLSSLHIAAVDTTIEKWTESFGVGSTIEVISLPVFVEWVASHIHGTKGRGAQLRHSHLLTIARWRRSRGFIADVPFEHAPKPEARLAKHRPATPNEVIGIAGLLPP